MTLYSCAYYSTREVAKEDHQKISLQNYYSPCCGSCGQRIIIDSLIGKKYTLQINCQNEDESSRLCTPFQLGTQKQVITYQKHKTISISYYKPVYDTVELKRQYPKIERGEYFDSKFGSNQIIPLSSIDSLLIAKYLVLAKKTNCSGQYIKLIKGFMLVEEDRSYK